MKIRFPMGNEDTVKRVQTRIEHIRSMSVEELADKILASEISTNIDFCMNFKECEEKLDHGIIEEENCKKCLIKWLNSSEEQQKEIPTEHLMKKFNKVV